MSKRKHNAIIFAHPDDEILFFSSLTLQIKTRPWTWVCVTDANADGQGAQRMQQLKKSAQLSGVKNLITLGLPDLYAQRLNQPLLQQKLSSFENWHEIYTHGPLGEYGHPHHQDVSFAVHQLFHKSHKIYGAAYNCFGEKTYVLTKSQYQKKCAILSKVYLSETERLIHFLPATNTESFTRYSWPEVKSVYSYFTEQNSSLNKLQKFRWYQPYFQTQRERIKTRPF